MDQSATVSNVGQLSASNLDIIPYRFSLRQCETHTELACCLCACPQVAFSLVYTKTDVHHPGLDAPAHNIAAFNNAVATVSGVSPPYFPTSATTGHGREPLLKYLAQLKHAFKIPLVFH